MPDSIHPRRLTRSPRARLLAAAALVSGILVGGCGGSSGSPTVATVSTSTSSAASTGVATTATSSTTTGDGAASSGPPTQAALQSDELAYAKCMRANGVPNFPDPRGGGGSEIARGAGIDPSSPAFKAAQAKCQKLVPGLGAGPGSGPPPSARAMAQMLQVARCMRRHGIYDFPDPRTSVPSNPRAVLGGSGTISDIDGVILVFPGTIDQQSPVFTRAAAACNFPLHNH